MSVLELVRISVAPERVADYQSAFAEARPLVLQQPGCRSCRLLPNDHESGCFVLLIEWNDRADHTEGFRRSPEYKAWSALLHPFYDVFPTVEYYRL